MDPWAFVAGIVSRSQQCMCVHSQYEEAPYWELASAGEEKKRVDVEP